LQVRSLAVKRAIDVVGASVGLVVAAIPMAVIALTVRATMGSPVLFRQVRPGLGGRPFTLVKFRSMRDGPGDDIDRLTRTGAFLRATSLDELPELWSVLKGDMSLVGPRPLLMSYLPLYSPEQARRHEMRPGLTGLAQVEGRNLVDWPERLAMDVHYVDTWSVWGDLRIIVRTVAAVLRRTGISAEDEATMRNFTGNEPTSGGEP
jgi:lipopolysaccharide/colanic/teichoic acid biosynthesis glycosyltransferase